MNGVTAVARAGEETKFLHVGNVLTVSLVHVICGAALMAMIVLVAGGFVDSIKVDLGLHYYSESLSPLSTPWLPMPFNTVVNAGYTAVGIFWILHVRRHLDRGDISVDEGYLMYVFAWMILIYGPVQLVRIVTQWRVAGILDQWYTLPIFAWVGISCRQIGHASGGLDNGPVWLITASVASYGVAIFHSRGFEVVLAAHICAVVVQAWLVHRQSFGTELDRQIRWSAFTRAVVCCTAFVLLKLADWHLAQLLPMPFTTLSGHFCSKVADFMQAHYACCFLEAALPTRLHSKVKSDC